MLNTFQLLLMYHSQVTVCFPQRMIWGKEWDQLPIMKMGKDLILTCTLGVAIHKCFHMKFCFNYGQLGEEGHAGQLLCYIFESVQKNMQLFQLVAHH